MSRLLSATLLYAAACAAPPQLPSLSLRAITVIHERAAAANRKHAVDYAFTAQLTFLTDPKDSADLTNQLTPEVQLFDETLTCPDPTLCLWASAAEQSALLALGVLR